MKKSISFIVSVFSASLVCAQPTHVPVASYTQHPMGYSGYSLATLPASWQGNFSSEPDDIASDKTYHYQTAVSAFMYNPVTEDASDDIVIIKKQAANGLTTSIATIDIAHAIGLSSWSDEVIKGMLIDVSLGRLYVFGSTNVHGFNQGYILCVKTSTLAPDLTFSSTGVQFLYTAPGNVVMDMDIIEPGKYLALVQMNGYVNLVGIKTDGTWLGMFSLSNPAYSCVGNRLRKAPNNTFFIAGRAANSSGVYIPMLWDLSCMTSPFSMSLLKKTNDSFTSPVVGTGDYVDFGFHDTGKLGLDGLPGIELMVVGNRNANVNGPNTGIYAKYSINATSLAPYTTYTNNTTLPGIHSSFSFTRCLVQPDGYVVFVGRDDTQPPMFDSFLGYINTTGTAYTTTHAFQEVHKVRALNKDYSSGDVIAGGCDMGNGGWSTIRFTSYSGTWSACANKMTGIALSNNDEATELKMFPNPCNNVIKIEGLTAENKAVTIQVLDMKGSLVKELNNFAVFNAATGLSIDVSDLQEGQYIIRVINNEQCHTVRMVKN